MNDLLQTPNKKKPSKIKSAIDSCKFNLINYIKTSKNRFLELGALVK